MSWITHPAVTWIRAVGRALGVNRVIARLGEHGYEASYDRKLSTSTRAGDVVWDIGANVGYYTTRFAKLVGTEGKVIAFEPSAHNYAQLQAACANLHNVSLHSYGLGKVRGQFQFKQGDDELGATSRVMDGDSIGVDVVEIRVGDDLISDENITLPNVIKMDVEGFEGEVLEGLTHCLAAVSLRAVGVEVHFGILEQRGLGNAPKDIEDALKQAGFSVSWPDRSHLLATR